MRRAAIVSVEVAPAAAIAAAWLVADTPVANVTMKGLVGSSVGAGVGSAVGPGVGSAVGSEVGAGVGSAGGSAGGSAVGSADGSAVGDGSGGGGALGSSDGGGEAGGSEGSAAIVPAGATRAKTRRLTCSPIRSRQIRLVRRSADPNPNIRPELPHPTPKKPLPTSGCALVAATTLPDDDGRPYGRWATVSHTGPADRTMHPQHRTIPNRPAPELAVPMSNVGDSPGPGTDATAREPALSDRLSL